MKKSILLLPVFVIATNSVYTAPETSNRCMVESIASVTQRTETLSQSEKEISEMFDDLPVPPSISEVQEPSRISTFFQDLGVQVLFFFLDLKTAISRKYRKISTKILALCLPAKKS